MDPQILSPLIAFAFIGALIVYEAAAGKDREGRKTREDWAMFGWSTAGIALVERPLLTALVTLGLATLVPGGRGGLAWIAREHLAAGVVGFILIDELLHGWAHNFAHGSTPKNPVLAAIKRFYLEAHRPHHMNGGPDGRGELSVTQVTVAGWGWFFFLPNYWFGVACLYFGLAEVWLWGFTIKNLWGVHVHANWTYDLYLLNHGSPWVRKATRALCHVLTLPNQHHHHHGRGANSGKNMQNMLALYDWLLWKTLVIETERPAVYGWRQTEREARSPFHRYVRRTLPFSRLGNGLRAR